MRPEPTGEIALGRDARRGVRVGAAPPDEPLALDARLAGHQPDLVTQLGQPALDELDGLDDDRGRPIRLSRADGREDAWPDGRVDDRLEVAQRVRVGEHDPPERGPIQGANELVINLASAVSSLGSGVILAGLGYRALGMAGAALALLPLLLVGWQALLRPRLAAREA